MTCYAIRGEILTFLRLAFLKIGAVGTTFDEYGAIIIVRYLGHYSH